MGDFGYAAVARILLEGQAESATATATATASALRQQLVARVGGRTTTAGLWARLAHEIAPFWPSEIDSYFALGSSVVETASLRLLPDAFYDSPPGGVGGGGAARRILDLYEMYGRGRETDVAGADAARVGSVYAERELSLYRLRSSAATTALLTQTLPAVAERLSPAARVPLVWCKTRVLNSFRYEFERIRDHRRAHVFASPETDLPRELRDALYPQLFGGGGGGGGGGNPRPELLHWTFFDVRDGRLFGLNFDCPAPADAAAPARFDKWMDADYAVIFLASDVDRKLKYYEHRPAVPGSAAAAEPPPPPPPPPLELSDIVDGDADLDAQLRQLCKDDDAHSFPGLYAPTPSPPTATAGQASSSKKKVLNTRVLTLHNGEMLVVPQRAGVCVSLSHLLPADGVARFFVVVLYFGNRVARTAYGTTSMLL